MSYLGALIASLGILCSSILVTSSAIASTTQQVAQGSASPNFAVDESSKLQRDLLAKQVQEQATSFAALQSRQTDLEKRALEVERKSIDWWFAWLAIFTTLIGVGGALIPYLLGRKDKELLALEIGAAQRARQDVERLLNETASAHEKVKDHETQSSGAVAQTQQNLVASKRLLESARSSSTETEVRKRQQQTAAQQVLGSTEAAPVDRLRAQAIEAETRLDAELATLLWYRVLALAPNDANAAFNYAYWLQEKTTKLVHSTSQDWETVGRAYEKAQILDQNEPKNPWIPNNWGGAMVQQALALKEAGDLDGAKALCKAAGEKFAQALEIKEDMHEPAYNWGNALVAEAQAFNEGGDLDGACALWTAAGEMYSKAIGINPNHHEAAHNWGNALSDEAMAVKERNLPSARALWRAAGKQYAFALKINKNKYETAYNWGIYLGNLCKSQHCDGLT